MADTYKEYLIKHKKSAKDNILQGGIIVGGLIIGFFGLGFLGSVVGGLLLVVLVFGGYTLFTRFDKEYEYTLTNNELDIDVIFSKQKRKRVLTVDMKKIEIMASIKDQMHAGELSKNAKLIDASDGKNEKDTYAIMFAEGEGLKKILITPNESFLNYLFKQAPNKVFKQS